MFLHGFRKRAEDDPELGKLFLERRRDRDAIEYRVHRHAREELALAKWDAEFFVRLEELGIDFIEALRSAVLRFRRRVVGDLLIIDRRVPHRRPVRFGRCEPMTVGFKPPLEHEFRLALLGGN